MRLLLCIVAAALLAGAVGTGYRDVAELYHALTTGQRALTSASAGLSGGALERAAAGELDLNQSCAELGTAAGAFTEAATGIGRMGSLLRLAEAVPPAAARVDAGLALVTLATEVSAAGDGLCQGMRPLAALLRGERSGARPLPEELLEALAASRPGLEQARLRLARADVALAQVRPEEQDARTRDALATLGTKLPALRNGVDALLVLPQRPRAHRPRPYLLLLPNREEL